RSNREWGSDVGASGLTATADNDAATVGVSGTSVDVAEGEEVAITITDQNGDTVTATATVDENGDFSAADIDVSGLSDGELSIDADRKSVVEGERAAPH